MPAPYGVTPTGFSAKTQEEIEAEIVEAELANISPTLKTSADTAIGQLNGILSGKLRELWELAQAAYNAFNPDMASQAQLDAVSAISGTIRQAATKGTVTLQCTLLSGTTLEAGVHFAEVAGNPNSRWTPVVDYTAPGDGTYDVACECEVTGPIIGLAGTITIIATPVAGWSAVTNGLDATPGQNVESDALLRVRRQLEITQQAGSPVDGIRADILTVDSVVQCTVFENPNPWTDTDGLPPHSFEAVVQGGADADIAERIFASKAAGIRAFGNDVTEVVEDSTGKEHTIQFSRPTIGTLWLEIDVDVDDDYPATGDTDIKAAIVAFADADYMVGDDVILSKLVDVIFDAVAGIYDVTEIRAGWSASPSGTSNLTVGPRELAEADTSRITVTSTPI